MKPTCSEVKLLWIKLKQIFVNKIKNLVEILTFQECSWKFFMMLRFNSELMEKLFKTQKSNVCMWSGCNVREQSFMLKFNLQHLNNKTKAKVISSLLLNWWLYKSYVIVILQLFDPFLWSYFFLKLHNVKQPLMVSLSCLTLMLSGPVSVFRL